MHRLATILLLLLAAPSQSAIRTSWDSARFLKESCDLLEMDCKSVPDALIVYTSLDGPYGLYIPGGNTVYIEEGCLSGLADQWMCKGIILHELAHYIMHHFTPLMEHCESERIAWGVYNRYVLSINRPDLERPFWIRNYPQCRAEVSK